MLTRNDGKEKVNGPCAGLHIAAVAAAGIAGSPA